MRFIIALGFSYIPRELREMKGEIEAARAGFPPELLTHQDIRGMTHCYRVYSDGREGRHGPGRRGHGHGLSHHHRSFAERPLRARRRH